MTTVVVESVIGVDGAGTVAIENGVITEIGGRHRADLIEMPNLRAAPGLIDIQINGAYGDDFTNDPESIWRVGQRLPSQGVTSFLPTIISAPEENVARALAVVAVGPPSGYLGAKVLGLHIEGPMISAARKGTHNESLLQLPSLPLIEGWARSAGVAMVTMAPELPGAEEVVAHLRSAGVTVAAGHTAANYDQARQGFRWGMSHVTHLFNAMEPFDHREPGLIGAMIADRRVTAGLIVDGIHSHPAAVAGAWSWFGIDRLALVTDAMAAAGVGDGTFQIGDVQVTVKDGRATNADGRLAGSTLTMNQAVRNLINFTGCDVSEAIGAASTVPANIVGRRDLGRLEPGTRADLVFLNNRLEVMATMVGGDIVWRRELQ